MCSFRLNQIVSKHSVEQLAVELEPQLSQCHLHGFDVVSSLPDLIIGEKDVDVLKIICCFYRNEPGFAGSCRERETSNVEIEMIYIVCYDFNRKFFVGF